jgi:gas vesicle protein
VAGRSFRDFSIETEVLVMYDYRRGGSVFGAFLLGGLVGAVLGLLFAPRSGRETREMLASKAEDYWGEGVELYNTGKERAGEMYSTGRERVAEQSEQLRGKIDEARGRLQEQVAKSADAAKDKVGDVMPAAKDAVDKAATATKSGIDTMGTKAQGTLDSVSKKAKGAGEDVAEASAEMVETPVVPEV